MQNFLSTISRVYKDESIEVKKKHRLVMQVDWLNSVNGRTLLHGTGESGDDTVFLFIVAKESCIKSLGKKFTSVADLAPEGVDHEIESSDHILFIQYRKEFKIKKSNSFRILGSAVYHNRKTGKSTVIQEIAVVCTCDLNV